MSVCLFNKARIPKKMASELEDEVAFDESISELVRAHPCLYDKRNRDYKDRNINMDAWASVAGKLGLEDGGYNLSEPRVQLLQVYFMFTIFGGINGSQTI